MTDNSQQGITKEIGSTKKKKQKTRELTGQLQDSVETNKFFTFPLNI